MVFSAPNTGPNTYFLRSMSRIASARPETCSEGLNLLIKVLSYQLDVSLDKLKFT